MQTIALKTYGASSDVEGYCDKFVAIHGAVYVLSLIGNDSAVKALAAQILEKRKSYEPDSLHLEDKSIVRRRKDTHYRVISQKLGSGLIHTLIADNLFWEPTKDEPDTRVFLMEDDEKPEDVLYDQVLRSTATPLLPEWRTWIYEQLLHKGSVKLINGYGCNMLACKVLEEKLDELVSRGVREGMLTWQH